MPASNPDSAPEAAAPAASPRQNGTPGIAGPLESPPGEDPTIETRTPRALSVMSESDSESARAIPAPDDSESAMGRGQSEQLKVASDPADDDSIREFYSQLVTLLTQDGAPPPKKKSRNSLLSTLRRHWFPALAVSALAFLGLFSVLRPRHSTYQVSVTLLLPPRSTAGSQNSDPFAPPEESYDTEAEMAIIESREVVIPAMKRVPGTLKIRGWGSRLIKAAPVEAVSYGSPSLVNLNVSSLDYGASRRLVQEMVASYQRYTLGRYRNNRDTNLKITSNRVKKSNLELEIARTQLRRFKEKKGVSDVASLQGGGSIVDLESALSKERTDAAGGGDPSGSVGLLRQRALEAQNRYQDTLAKYLPGFPESRKAEIEWRRAQAQAQTAAQAAKAASARRIAGLQARLNAARSRSAALPGIEQNLNSLNEQVQLLETAYRGASNRYNQLNLAKGTVAPLARVLQEPSGGSSARSQLTRALAAALVAALGLGVLSAWLLNHFDRSVRTVSDPEAFFDVPVLGVMPATGGKSGLQLSGMMAKRGRSALQTATLEACYTTQNNLLATAKSYEAHSILITSAVPGEGKSQCASNLATAMAYGGQSVLLIDADFLHPSQHEILKVSLEPGYAQVLRDELDLTGAVRSTHVSNLHLLSAGKNALKNPEEMVALFSGPAHQHNLKKLCRLYDVVLIDAPPTMSMADAQLLSKLADSIVLVAAQGTHQEEVYRARSMLRLAGGLLLGVIVNSVNLKEMGNWNLNFSSEVPFSNYANSLRGRNH